MKRCLIILVLLLSAAPASAQRVDGELSRQYGKLIDSLVAFIGEAPLEVRRGAGVMRDGALEKMPAGWRITLSMNTTRGRFAVLHEFGHFLNAVRGAAFYAYLDSLGLNAKFDKKPSAVWEQFADDFAWAWMAHENDWGESFRPGADLLRRMLWTNPVVLTNSH